MQNHNRGKTQYLGNSFNIDNLSINSNDDDNSIEIHNRYFIDKLSLNNNISSIDYQSEN